MVVHAVASAHGDDEKLGAVSMIVVSGQIAFTACVSCGR